MEHNFNSVGIGNGNGPVVAILCPHCGHHGTFHSHVPDIHTKNGIIWLGQRFCPNPNCRKHIFHISKSDGELIGSYPGGRIPINKDNLPARILSTIEEANTCYSNDCFIAAGIMIRKTLEVLCEDKGIKGPNLKNRLKKLGSAIFIPQELVSAMDELRLLGNDATHVKATTYDSIGKTEIEISMEFSKEILKAVYQYDGLLAKLQSLKKSDKE